LEKAIAETRVIFKDIPGPYRFFFYSFDGNEPRHVHVRRERMVCKFWLEPVSPARNHGFPARELNVIRAHIQEHMTRILEAWDETAVSSDARIKTAEVSDEMITAHLADGRIISVPLAWSWRLASAIPAQRAHYEIIGDG